MFNNIFWTFPIVYMLKKQYLCCRFFEKLAFTPYTLHFSLRAYWTNGVSGVTVAEAVHVHMA